MAVWKHACKTMQGMELDLKLLGRDGIPLSLTKAKAGSGSISPTQLMTLADVLEPVQDLELQAAVECLDGQTVRLPVILKNTDLEERYDMRQLGIYAEDPDKGEILYIVLQSESAEPVPSAGETKDFTLEWYLNLSVGNAEKVEVAIRETCTLTVEEGDVRYVRKEPGKGLSSNDYTDAEKGKVADVYGSKYVDSHFAPGGALTHIFTAKGWYRVAKESNPEMSWVQGGGNYSCGLSIKRDFNNAPPECHKIQLLSQYQKSKIVNVYSSCHSQVVTAVRHTVDGPGKAAYIEVYYSKDSRNAVHFTLLDSYNSVARFELVEPELTEETVSGVAVYSKLELPANFDIGDLMPKTGGEFTGLVNPSGGMSAAGKDYYIAYPENERNSNPPAASVTGYCKITLPVSWTNTMLAFTASIYDYATGETADYRVSGYNYMGVSGGASAGWMNCTAVCIGKYGAKHSDLPVRFGHDGEKCAILIGEASTIWEYPQVRIHDILVGFSKYDYATFGIGWAVSFQAAALSVTNITISNTHVANGVPASRLATEAGTTDVSRRVYFANTNATNAEAALVYDDDFKYNPATNTLTVANVSGTAAKAVRDGDGNVIADTYAKKTEMQSGGKVTIFKSLTGYLITNTETCSMSISSLYDGCGGSDGMVDITVFAGTGQNYDLYYFKRAAFHIFYAPEDRGYESSTGGIEVRIPLSFVGSTVNVVASVSSTKMLSIRCADNERIYIFGAVASVVR